MLRRGVMDHSVRQSHCYTLKRIISVEHCGVGCVILLIPQAFVVNSYYNDPFIHEHVWSPNI